VCTVLLEYRNPHFLLMVRYSGYKYYTLYLSWSLCTVVLSYLYLVLSNVATVGKDNKPGHSFSSLISHFDIANH
jgi:hypothetical protein